MLISTKPVALSLHLYAHVTTFRAKTRVYIQLCVCTKAAVASRLTITFLSQIHVAI